MLANLVTRSTNAQVGKEELDLSPTVEIMSNNGRILETLQEGFDCTSIKQVAASEDDR